MKSMAFGLAFGFLLVCGSLAAQGEGEMHAYMKWCEDNGVDFTHVEIKRNPEPPHHFYESRHDAWVVATKDAVPASTNLFSVPEHLTISSASAMESENYGYVFKKPPQNVLNDEGDYVLESSNEPVVSHPAVVALTIMLERQDANSFWKPWLDVLPTYIFSALTCPRREMEHLTGSSGAYHMVKKRQAYEAEYEQLVKPIIEKYPEIFLDKEEYSREAYMAALTVVLGYGHVANITNDQPYVVMVPVLDLVSPRISKNHISSFKDSKDGVLTLSSEHSLAANTRVVASPYTTFMKDNFDLLMYRGEAVNDVRYFALVTNTVIECPQNSAAELCQRKKALFEKVAGTSNFVLSIPFGEFPPFYVSLHRILHIESPDEFVSASHISSGKPISLENDARAHEDIIKKLETQREGYDDLMEEDEIKLKRKSVKSDSTRAFVMYRYGEKRVIQTVLKSALSEQAAVLDKVAEQNRKINKKAMKKRKNA